MRILVDADSCPKPIRRVIVRAARRVGIETIFVANRPIPLPSVDTLRMITVEATEGAADAYLVEHAEQGDLAISRDIPLAAALVERGATVLDVRGQVYTRENVGERLSIRNFMTKLRHDGTHAQRERPLGNREIMAFANALDRTLAKVGRD